VRTGFEYYFYIRIFDYSPIVVGATLTSSFVLNNPLPIYRIKLCIAYVSGSVLNK